jgi:asparagine synthase (glutamine-hydrolysing)
MCGFNFIFDQRGTYRKIISEMNLSIAHRGPDADEIKGLDISGNIINEGAPIWLGHRRLSIIDTESRANQPFEFEDWIIIFNGEIYNYLELREELIQSGNTFKTTSDTEVLIQAYAKWGKEVLNKLNGMFSFLILNRRTLDVFIARDRFAIKPLYYSLIAGGIIFSSEIKAILCHPKVKTDPNLKYVSTVLERGGCEHLEETAIEKVFRFKPAHYSVFNLKDFNGNFKQIRYWNFPEEINQKSSIEENTERYYSLLQDAVSIRLRSDVKVGSALSGGIDSSSIVYLVNQILGEDAKEKQHTFSSVYPSEATKDCDESEFILELAKDFNVNAHTIEPKWQDIPEAHSKMIHLMDGPIGGSCMSGWHTFKLVKENQVKVTLDGQGADEQLAGYLPFLTNALIHSNNFDEEAKGFEHIPGAQPHIKKAKRIRPYRYLIPEALSEYLFNTWNKKYNPFLPLNKQLQKDMNTTLMSLFHYSDRVSMGHSIESRVPFMDYRLVEFLATVPDAHKIHQGWTKLLARKAFDKKINDKIVWRKDKMGWPNPERYWFQEKHLNWSIDLVNASKTLQCLELNSQNKKSFQALPTKVMMRLVNIAGWEKTTL